MPQPEKRTGKGHFFLIALGVLVIAVCLSAIAACGRKSNADERQKTGQAQQAGGRTVHVTKPSQSPPSFEFSLPGSAEALTTATLYARVAGYLKKRYVDIGDRVEKDQLLAEIDAPDVMAQLSQATAQLEQTRAAEQISKVTYEREQKLVDQKVVSRQEYDQSEAAFHQAQANTKAGEASVQNLNVQKGFTRITAPFAGVITARNLDEGDLISNGGTTAIFTLAESDVLRVYIFVPQSYSASVHEGQQVDVLSPDMPARVFKGHVTRSADALDPNARTERVEIQLPSDNGALLPGMYLSVKFTVQQDTPALIVPSNTVDIRKEGARVAVVDGNKKVKYTPVTLGRDFGKTIEIVTGLKGEETLVVNPTPELSDGAQVEIAKEADKEKDNNGGQSQNSAGANAKG